MALIAGKADFEGGWYSDYALDDPVFDERLAVIRPKLSPGDKVLVAGCGPGYLVHRLFQAGFDAFGIDASPYAVHRGRSELPVLAGRLAVGNVLNEWAMVDAAYRAGGDFRLAITEELLPCLNDREACLAAWNLALVAGEVYHFVAAREGAAVRYNPVFNNHTPREWRDLIPDGQGIFCSETGREV